MKTIGVTVVIVALLVVAGAVGLVYSGIYDVSASKPHAPLTRWIMKTSMRSSIARRADRVEVPELGDESLVLAGAMDFESMCVQCHGAPGREPEEIGLGLNPPAPDLAESAAEMSAAEMFWVTKHGIRMTGMPAWGQTHPDDALWPVIALMTVLPGLDRAGYEALLSRADGMGHHEHNGAGNGHVHGAGDEHEPQDNGEPSRETEHDHDTHDH